jgi:hypothetical protein
MERSGKGYAKADGGFEEAAESEVESVKEAA